MINDHDHLQECVAIMDENPDIQKDDIHFAIAITHAERIADATLRAEVRRQILNLVAMNCNTRDSNKI